MLTKNGVTLIELVIALLLLTVGVVIQKFIKPAALTTEVFTSLHLDFDHKINQSLDLVSMLIDFQIRRTRSYS